MGAPRPNKNKYIHHLLQLYNMIINNSPRRAVRSVGTSTIVGNQIGSSPTPLLSTQHVNVEDLLLENANLKAECAELTRKQGLKDMLNLGPPELNPIALVLLDEMTGEKQVLEERARVAEQKIDEFRENLWNADFYRLSSQDDACIDCNHTYRVCQLLNGGVRKCSECDSDYCLQCWIIQRSKWEGELGEDSSKINWLVEKYPDGVCYECAFDALGDREWSATGIQALARGYLARKSA